MNPAKSPFLKPLILNGFLFLLALSLKAPIEALINKVLVLPILSNLRTSYLNDVVVLAVISLLVFFVYKSNIKPSIPTLIFLSTLSSIYLIYRVGVKFDSFYHFNTYNFQSFKSLNWLKYTDLLWAVLLTCAVKYSTKNETAIKVDYPEPQLLQDIPISELKEDQLKFKGYIQELSKRINNTLFQEAFAIAINAKWGMGKTSFLNLLEEELKKSNCNRIIKFDPWKSKNSHSISKDFFALLEDEINSYDLKVKSRIREYSDKLEGSGTGLLAYLNKMLISEVFPQKSKSDIYEQIKDYFRTVEKKLIIFIDDIDRLDSDEILEILRLVRNTANFPNISYILAYDREYVIQAIKSKSIANSETFLEKIIQLEIPLPFYTPQLLNVYFEKVFKKKFETVLLEQNGINHTFFSNWLINIRDINRFINALDLNYARLSDEVDFADYFRLELLRFKYPAVHHLIFIKQDVFFDSSSSQNYKFTFKTKQQKEFKQELESIKSIKYHLLKNLETLSIRTSEVADIILLLEKVFPDNATRYEPNRERLHANYPQKFNRYFTYQLQDKE